MFRTSEGRTPGKSEPVFEDDEPDTESPDDETNEFAETLSDIEPATAEPVVVKAAEQKKTGGCFQAILVMFGVVGLSIAFVIAALVYLLFFYRPTDTVTF